MMSNGSYVCVFVASSDRTRDVLDRVFAHFDRIWPDCPYARFVGLTTLPASKQVLGFTVIAADSETGWRQELAEQISKLPAEFDRVLLLLDDFLFLRKIDTPYVEACVHEAITQDMPYLRMKPLERSWIVRLARSLFAPVTIAEKLSRNEVFYSSVQAVVWKKEHLLWCLERPGSIWDFEHILPPVDHWAVRRAALPYRHIVEKARWMADAPALFRQAGLPFDPGARAVWPWRVGLEWRLGRIKFGLLGYFGMKVKWWLRGASVPRH